MEDDGKPIMNPLDLKSKSRRKTLEPPYVVKVVVTHAARS